MIAILRSWFLALAIMLALTVPASAGPFEDGKAAYEREDYTTALKLWRPLAEQGHAQAQHKLGDLHDAGLGVPQDDTEAVKWWRKAAEQGDAGAQNRLGQMYRHGQGVPLDYVLAYMWFNLAAAQGSDGSRIVRDFLASKMTPDQIAEAQSMAREWMAKHQQ